MAHHDLLVVVALLDDRESRQPLPRAARLMRTRAKREIRRREAVTDQARRILRG